MLSLKPPWVEERRQRQSPRRKQHPLQRRGAQGLTSSTSVPNDHHAPRPARRRDPEREPYVPPSLRESGDDVLSSSEDEMPVIKLRRKASKPPPNKDKGKGPAPSKNRHRPVLPDSPKARSASRSKSQFFFLLNSLQLFLLLVLLLYIYFLYYLFRNTMYDCKAPLSRFYYPETRRIINAFIIIICH